MREKLAKAGRWLGRVEKRRKVPSMAAEHGGAMADGGETRDGAT